MDQSPYEFSFKNKVKKEIRSKIIISSLTRTKHNFSKIKIKLFLKNLKALTLHNLTLVRKTLPSDTK